MNDREWGLFTPSNSVRAGRTSRLNIIAMSADQIAVRCVASFVPSDITATLYLVFVGFQCTTFSVLGSDLVSFFVLRLFVPKE